MEVRLEEVADAIEIGDEDDMKDETYSPKYPAGALLLVFVPRTCWEVTKERLQHPIAAPFGTTAVTPASSGPVPATFQ